MRAAEWSRAAGGRRPSRSRWLPALLLLLLAALGPQLAQPGTGPSAQVTSQVAFGALGGDGAVVAALARPTGVAVARGDDRSPSVPLAAVLVAAVPVPSPVAVGLVPDPSYDVLAGVPTEPTSRGPPVES